MIQDAKNHRPSNLTQKPVELRMQELVCFCKKGQVVWDFCFGTGLMAMAAIWFSCDVVVVELEKRQFDLILQRLRNLEAEVNYQQLHYELFFKLLLDQQEPPEDSDSDNSEEEEENQGMVLTVAEGTEEKLP